MLVIHDENGERMVDDGPINDFIAAVESGNTVRQFRTMGTLDREQMRHALSQLACEYKAKKQLVERLMTESGVKSMQEIIDLAKMARDGGESLWPELLESASTTVRVP